MNIISTTGRIPNMDEPMANPEKAASEIGVSMTRLSPYFSQRPSVTL